MSSSSADARRENRAAPRRSERGALLVLLAFGMVALLGVTALVVDGSWLYAERLRLAGAADAAAKSAAFALRAHGTAANLRAYADEAIAAHGFDPAGVGVVVNNPPQSGPFASSSSTRSGYVEVILDRPTATFFAPLLGDEWTRMTTRVRAVAGSLSGPLCLVALGGGTSLEIAGTINVTMPTCEIAGNGNISVGSGSGAIQAKSVGVTGSCSGTCSVVTTGAAVTSDPLRDLVEPANPYSGQAGGAKAFKTTAPRTTIYPGWYSSIVVGNSDTLEFMPGLYYIDGPFIANQQSNLVGPTGGGLTFFLAGSSGVTTCGMGAAAGCLGWANGVKASLRAAESGMYAGILFFQARADRITSSTGNAGDLNLYGALYFPKAKLEYGNSGAATNDCIMLVADSLKLGTGGGSGTESFSNSCAGVSGNSPLLGVSVVE